jgi:3-hydroxy acid dehydrogenase/malonic semialdehyde reductase
VYEDVHGLTAEDSAGVVYWSGALPAHVDINLVQMLPVQQAFALFAVHRR